MPESVKYGGALSVSNGPLLRFDREFEADIFELATVDVDSTVAAGFDVPVGTKLRAVAIFADQYEPSAVTYQFDTSGSPVCTLNQPVVLTGGALALLGATKATTKVTLKLTPTMPQLAITVHVLVARTL